MISFLRQKEWPSGPLKYTNHGKGMKIHNFVNSKLGLILAASLLCLAVPVQAQRANGLNSIPPQAVSTNGLGSGPIHAGDYIDITIYDEPDMSVKTTVSASGDVILPIYGIFHIEGLSATEAVKKLSHDYVDRGLLINPKIVIGVNQYGSGVTVMGEVTQPGYYSIIGRNHLVDALAQAGGLSSKAGHLIQITPRDNSLPRRGVRWDPSLKDTTAPFTTLNPGDTVMVSRCGLVYVHGNVTRAGGFPICDTSAVTITQALSLAGGTKLSTAYNRVLLIRVENGTHTVHEIHLNDIIHGRAADIPLQDDDVLYVQPSWLKASGQRVIEYAIAFSTNAFLYLQ
jgi:polysaccharide export outer membrane protein